MPKYTKGRKATGVKGKTGPKTRKKVTYTKGRKATGVKGKTGPKTRKKVKATRAGTKRGSWRFK